MFYISMGILTTIVTVIIAKITGLGEPYVYDSGEVSYLENGIGYIVAGVVWPFTIAVVVFIGLAVLLGFLGAP